MDRSAYYKEYRSRPEVKEKQKQHQMNWRKRNPQKSSAMSKRNWKIHGHKFNKQKREKQKIEISFIGDNYVIKLIRDRGLGLLNAKNIPKELIEIIRLSILTTRKLKQHDNNSNMLS